jgi:hypothetical protein
MGYSEEDGAVVLRLSPGDYSRLMLALRYAALKLERNPESVMTFGEILELANRLNEGRPGFRPYSTLKPRGFA